MIGKTTCRGDNEVEIEDISPCERCYPTCKKCGCFGVQFMCGCFKFNHECTCHKDKDFDYETWEASRYECDTCGPKLVEDYIKCWNSHWRFGNRLEKEMRRRLKEFKGGYAEQHAMLEQLRKDWNGKYEAACMTRDELAAWETATTHPIFKGEKSEGGKILQRRMWDTLVPNSVRRKFANVQAFIEYTKGFKKDGVPKRMPKF